MVVLPEYTKISFKLLNSLVALKVTSSGLSLRIFRHSYCGRVVQKSHSFTPKFTRPHLEYTVAR